MKETWNVINSSLGRKPKMTVINELIDEGKVFVQKEDIAEQMNNHFYSLGSTPFAVHLRKIYNHLRQQLKL